jgi:bacterial/archaeal transporter family-2 protein
MNKALWIILTLFSGAFLPIQAGLNSRLGRAVESPLYASLFSFVVGTIALMIYILVTGQTLSWAGVTKAPAYLWIGGLLGAFYIAVTMQAFPVLGPGLTFGLIVAGQMIVSLILDHFNVLVAQQNPINPMKVLGGVLVIVGVVIIRKF